VVTFDLEGAQPGAEYNRIQSFFERLGWQNLGGTSYRYSKLGTEEPVEDWLNHVVPALMLLRAYLTTTGRPLKKFTLDCQSSAGYDRAGPYGTLLSRAATSASTPRRISRSASGI
jgi:hypothetical protein